MNLALTIITNELKQVRFYIVVIFAFVYCQLSLVNHQNFHTYAYDLGIYNNSIYQYGHLINNPHPYGHNAVTNFLGDHFSLYTIILSPLHYLFGTYTLLYVQIASILFGGVGIYKLVKNWHPNTYLPEIALFHFFAFYGIFSALSFDYHDNVVGTMFVPWFIYFLHINKLKWATLMAVLIVISKENMPLWLFSICLGLIVLYRNDKRRRVYLTIVGASSVVYALTIINCVMPAFVQHGANASHVQYSIFGDSVLETIIYKTRYIITAMFTNVSGSTFDDNIKEETYMCLLLSGGLCLLIRLEYAIMLVFIILQKMLNDDAGKWGINGHYSAELAPIVIIAFYSTLNYFENTKFKLVISVFFCLLTYSTTFTKMFIRDSYWYNEENGNLFSKYHYQSYYSHADVEKIIKMIPDDANLSALSCFGPHVAFRKNIYMFPDVTNANYILVAESPKDYPLQGDILHLEIMKYKNSPNWRMDAEINGIYLFKRLK